MSSAKSRIEAFVADPILQKRLAKYVVQRCFRNSVLEDFHAGTVPTSKAGDYSDLWYRHRKGKFPGPKAHDSMTRR
jgi:hypothetical protein